MRTNRPGSGEIDALRAQARGSPQARLQHRIHAVLLVAGGMSCRGAARLLGDSPRAVEYWVKRYNSDKINGLFNSLPPGRPARLTPARLADLRAAVAAGPPIAGAAGWRGEDVSTLISRRWGVTLGLRQAQRVLAKIRSN